MSRTNEDRANISAGMSVAERRDKAAELGVSLSDFKAGNWRPSQGATPKPSPSPSPKPSPSPSKPTPTPTPSPGPSKPSPTPTPSPSNWSTAKDKATTHSSNSKRTNEDRAAIAANMTVAERREKAAQLGISLKDLKAGVWRPGQQTNSSGGGKGGGKTYTQDELKDLFPAPPGAGPLPDTPVVGPVQPSPSPSPSPSPGGGFDPYIPPAPVVQPVKQPVKPTRGTDSQSGDEKSSPFRSSFVRNYVGFENPYPTQIQPINPGTTQPQPQPGPVGTTAPNPIRCDPPKINGGNGTGTTAPNPIRCDPPKINDGKGTGTTTPNPWASGVNEYGDPIGTMYQGGSPTFYLGENEFYTGADGTQTPGRFPTNLMESAQNSQSNSSKPPKTTGPGTNGTSFTPYSSTDYFNKYGTPAISQQMYINDPYEGSKGQGFYGAAQFTPTNPFTGEPYKLGPGGLPDHGNLYSQGTYLPGQLIPNKKK